MFGILARKFEFRSKLCDLAIEMTGSSPSRAAAADDAMAHDAVYRAALVEMQSEFTRAVDALEKQVACLTAHNELLEAAQQQQRTYDSFD